ncbi:hypothetical protein PF008_g4307 [Phytophthora fragariae]|uniref:Uncharacterized protein n=1 Tax=Phytophthora fragariae TaxID=53985 RepID=A0A6G0SDK6_9STRA|nr:hypothetical protein PF008_g4307 [Phytophthora fragariae]
MLDLPDDCPPEIRRDLGRLFKEAAAQGKAPFRVAYPWAGQWVWYDPQVHPDMYLVHWRYWMRFRPTFFNCALYAPTDSSEARHKKKSDAIQGRLIMISMNVMTFGYYGFLGLYEDGAHDMLMWLGGKAARHSVAAKAKAGSVVTSQTDLATLYRTDRPLRSHPRERFGPVSYLRGGLQEHP